MEDEKGKDLEQEIEKEDPERVGVLCWSFRIGEGFLINDNIEVIFGGKRGSKGMVIVKSPMSTNLERIKRSV